MRSNRGCDRIASSTLLPNQRQRAGYGAQAQALQQYVSVVVGRCRRPTATEGSQRVAGDPHGANYRKTVDRYRWMSWWFGTLTVSPEAGMH